MANRYSRNLSPELYRELFRKVPAALFERLSLEDELLVQTAVAELRDQRMAAVMRLGHESSMAQRLQLDDEVRQLNGVLP